MLVHVACDYISQAEDFMEYGVEGVGEGASISLVAIFNGIVAISKAYCRRLVVRTVKGDMGYDEVPVGFWRYHGGFEGSFSHIGFHPSAVFGSREVVKILNIHWRSVYQGGFL